MCQSKSQQTEGFISTDNPSSSKCQIGSWSMAHSSIRGARGVWMSSCVLSTTKYWAGVDLQNWSRYCPPLQRAPHVHNLHLEVFRIWGPYMVANRGFSRRPRIYRNFLLFLVHNYITSLSSINNCRLTFTQKEFSVLIFEKLTELF